MKISFVAFIFLLLGCNLEVNTVDPQASPTINLSKQQNVFIKEYKINRAKTSCGIKEVWIEYAWKNELSNGRKMQTRLNGTQLILRLDLKDIAVKMNEYLTNWEIIDSTYGILGSSNDVFVLDLNEKKLPNEFELYLNKRTANKENICRVSVNTSF